MKKYLLFSFVVLFSTFTSAQMFKVDSLDINTQSMNVDALELLLSNAKEDTVKAKILGELSLRYAFSQPEKGLLYGQQGMELSQKLNYKRGIADVNQSSAYCFWALGDYINSLQLALTSLHQYEDLKDYERIAWLYMTVAVIYRDIADYKKALVNAHRGIRLYDSLNLSSRILKVVVGSIYEKQNQLDSALIYVQKAYEMGDKQWGYPPYLLGNIQVKMKHYGAALTYYREALPLAIAANIKKDIVDIYNGLATLYKETAIIDSSIFYANEVLQKWSSTSYQKGVLEATNILAEAYKIKNNSDSTIKYLELSVALNNKLFNQEKEREIQNLAFSEQLREDYIARERERYQNRLKLYGSVTFGIVLLIIVVLLYRNNRHKQKANALLQQQKEKVESTLAELKSTQAQLIQSEKMASLGGLTAGIAHEIQNPLNFVNNFSEVNKEMIAELKEEINKGNYDEVKIIADDIEANEEKINHHGKRADAIVKGMLQHSRSSTGQKEPTDINALADEYLRLAYHGLRAKDKSFNATLETNYDQSIGKIDIIPQDIGRVILNLITNAFYAVEEKKKSSPPLNGSGDYEPVVTVSTKSVKSSSGGLGTVVISVADNGNGVPQKILDKIFQPFFTTKPTGEGTGLGLSLSYDIVKTHGGELKVDTKEGEGSVFIVQLPVV